MDKEKEKLALKQIKIMMKHMDSAAIELNKVGKYKRASFKIIRVSIVRKKSTKKWGHRLNITYKFKKNKLIKREVV